MLAIADHVVVGEPDEVFGEIARDLEEGTARRLYEIADKPDVTRTPAPRFDLLNQDCYASMSVQFSRGCPFQCEFCDIIILYGRKPRTALYDRMQQEGRILESRGCSSDGTPPNFRTRMDPNVLLRGFGSTVAAIYDAEKFYARAWRSLENWESKPCQHPAKHPTLPAFVGILARSIWLQGLRSSYRKAYWKYFFKIFTRLPLNRAKLWIGVTLLISGQHFIPYAGELARKVERELEYARQVRELVPVPVEP